MSLAGAAWRWLHAKARTYRAQLRFCIRVTMAAIVGLLIAQFFALPLHGLWVVLTATVVTQLSIGGSLRAGLEYVLGTLGGAVFAGFIGFLFSPTTVLGQSGILAVTIAPLAFLAALNPNFRVAPFSAVLVLLISGQFGEGPIESAVTRLLEVTLGGAVAVVVSFVIFPERAHRPAAEKARRILDEMAKGLPDILAGFCQTADAVELQRLHDRIGRMLSQLRDVAEEIKRERTISFTLAQDPAPLPRTLRRLHHDLVMMGRASLEPVPDHLRQALRPALDRVSETVAAYFRACGIALMSRRPRPPLQPVEDALAACAAQISATRRQQLTQLSPNQLEQLFTLGFALEQFQGNIKDLERCIEEWAPAARRAVRAPA
jgi:uncharacterized membrane protein YccC